MPRSLELEVEMVQSRRPRSKKPKAIEPTKRRRRASSKPRVAMCPPVDVCGQRFFIEAFFRDRDGVNQRGYEGQTTIEDNLIEVLQDAEDRVHDTLLHEIMHAIWDCSGFKFHFRAKIGKEKLSVAEFKWLEEAVCRTLAPALLQALRNAGWLRMPKVKKPRRVVHKSAAS